MSERMRELVFAGATCAALLLGVAIDVLAVDVEEAVPPASPGPRFVSRAILCAPSSAGEGSATAVVGSDSGGDVRVGVEPAVEESIENGAPPADPVELLSGSTLGAPSPEGDPLDVVGYGGRIYGSTVTATTEPVDGAGAATCALDASQSWYFAGGSTALGADERILIYNPFPDESVVELTLFTTRGIETRTSVRDLPVPAGSWESVELNDVIRVQGSVAVGVSARRGRVVAWREMFSKPSLGASGVELTLGATAPATTWYFPEGAIGAGVAERIYLLNPSAREAVAAVTLVTKDETLQPPDLMEVVVPPRSTLPVELSEARTGLRDLTGVSAVVSSTNDVGIVAERVTTYTGTGVAGVTAEVGATGASREWLVGAAARDPDVDAVIVQNPGRARATVDISPLSQDRGLLTPEALTGLRVRPGSRLRLVVGQWTGERSTALLVRSSAPVVVERFSYSSEENDAGAVMGTPVRQTP